MPLGLLYAASAAERCGHKARIIDVYIDDVDLTRFDSGDYHNIEEAIRDFNPAVIGYGGIATSYGRVKKLAGFINERYPGIIQITGGPLASVHKLLLTNTKVAVVFHAEAEISLPIFLKSIDEARSFYNTPGISYLKDGEIVRTDPEQVRDLDSIPLPSFDLVKVSRYLPDIQDWAREYKIHSYGTIYDDILKKIGTKKRYMPLVTSRGCTHKCLFCYRHVRGIRQHSVDYVINMIKQLKSRYGVDGFHFGDELFNNSVKWISEFCDALEREEIDIFYLLAGARVDRMDENTLVKLKETGCINIFYGQESGSDAILKEYGKGVTSRQNSEITILTEKLGIFSLPQIVIGSPGETDETIDETIRFLSDTRARQYSLNYLIPLPETPIWKHVEEQGLISDIESYLDIVAERGGAPIVNLTKASGAVWMGWDHRIRNALKLQRHKSGSSIQYKFYDMVYKIGNWIVPKIPPKVKRLIPQWVRRSY